MDTCPYCGVEIIAGTDECEECGQTLTELSLPVPGTGVEEDLLRDTVQALAAHQPLTVDAKQTVSDTLAKMAADRMDLEAAKKRIQALLENSKLKTSSDYRNLLEDWLETNTKEEP